MAWGWNAHGQTNVPRGLTNVKAISASGWHSLALKGDGTVVAWGYNGDGQTDVHPGLTGVEVIDAGATHNLALKDDGTVVAWGSDRDGRSAVPPDLTGVEAISAGSSHSLALVVDTTDTTPPTIQGAALDPASPSGQNGWYTSNVSVSWTVTDDESAISGQTGCDTQTVAADTVGLTLTCSATSGDGTSSESVTLKRDATGPNVDPVSRTPAANGWNNTDVTVDWSCGDATSGAVDPGVTQTVSTEGQTRAQPQPAPTTRETPHRTRRPASTSTRPRPS